MDTHELLHEIVVTIVVVVLAETEGEFIFEFSTLKYLYNFGSENMLKLIIEEEDDFLLFIIGGKFNEMVEAERFIDFLVC